MNAQYKFLLPARLVALHCDCRRLDILQLHHKIRLELFHRTAETCTTDCKRDRNVRAAFHEALYATEHMYRRYGQCNASMRGTSQGAFNSASIVMMSGSSHAIVRNELTGRQEFLPHITNTQRTKR